MGMDQYLVAIDKADGYEFPMAYWRKNYELNELICEYRKLDTKNCVVETEVTQDLIDHILEQTGSPRLIDFFKYLEAHMHREGEYGMQKVPEYEPNYKYIYRAGW